MNYVFPDWPYLLESHLDEMSEHELTISKHAVEQYHAKIDLTKGHNVRIDKTPELGKLWMIFLRICNTHFKNLVLADADRVGESLAYVRNEKLSTIGHLWHIWRKPRGWHFHLWAASITALYYPSVPNDTGSFSIIKPNFRRTGRGLKEEEIKIQQGNLYLFPGWLIHASNPQKFSGKDRVAIVLDLLTTTRPVLKDLNQPQEEIMW